MTSPMRRRAAIAASAGALTLVLSTGATAQFGNEWVEFSKDNSRIQADSSLVLNDTQEKDYAWGDVDNDGWTDLVVVRKQPFTSSGKRTNVLLMNENGVLVDRTGLYARFSDVPGDEGFHTPTNDRDVVLTDVDLDGWLDIVTATTLSATSPQHISHPRVYMNQGEDAMGVWQGFIHEAARIPQLLLSNGNPSWPRFCAVDAGDVTGDGYPDLYFADYDSGGTGGGDMNDRLLINDGTGHFVDESTLRMTTQMLNSNFGASAYIVDLNGDGKNDVVKDSGLTAFVRINYNGTNEGFFQLTDVAYQGSAYFANVGDLNNDGKLDIVISDDGADRYKYNTGNDALGRVIWGPAKTFNFVTGGDDGFAGNNLVVDLDLDSWPDVIITDVDVDIGGCSRRTHIYHNPGGNPGDQITLIEEAGPAGNAWRGVVGMDASDLRGTHDVAVFDIDNDGDPDMVFGLCGGTDVWMNQLDPSMAIGTNYCSTSPNSVGPGGLISAEGDESLAAENVTLVASGLPPNQPGLFFFGPAQTQTPFGNGFLCVAGGFTRIEPPVFADASGMAERALDFSAPYAPFISAGSTSNFQLWYRDPAAGGASFNLSDGVSILFQP